MSDDVVVPSTAWLTAEADRLAAAVASARRPEGGFGWLDDSLQLVPEKPAETWVTARMTHVAGLEVLRGNDFGELLDHGVRAFEGTLADAEHGGWFVSTGEDGRAEKRAYDHCFVVLAASTATVAGHPRGRALLDRALEVLDTHFWDGERGLLVDVWNRDWTRLEAYRGANANMHGVESMLAAADATGDRRWRDRAERVASTLVHEHARANSWRLPEHFDEDWQVLPEYNTDDRAHPFRPYGATVGHWLEWSRLLLHLRHDVPDAPAWLLQDSRSLFDASVREGWSVDGAPGFVYTVDAAGSPVVRARLHWVVCEAIAAAAAWREERPDPALDQLLAQWWAYAREHLIDVEHGSWRHELAPDNTPGGGTWSGKPDVYHAYQAALIGTLPMAWSLAGALRDR